MPPSKIKLPAVAIFVAISISCTYRFLHLSADGEDQFQGFRFIKDNLNKDIDQFLPYILRDGFDQDYSGLEIGTNSSNEGDGAEHLFVAKAMIAGFNCSVVDIGSSKYDAVIEDKNGDLLKVQINPENINFTLRKNKQLFSTTTKNLNHLRQRNYFFSK